MGDVLSRILGPVDITNGTSTLFTGTAAHVYTIKSMTVVNNTAGTITLKLGIGGVANANLIAQPLVIGAGEMAEWEGGMFVLSGTETLRANATADGLTITAHGLDQS